MVEATPRVMSETGRYRLTSKRRFLPSGEGAVAEGTDLGLATTPGSRRPARSSHHDAAMAVTW